MVVGSREEAYFKNRVTFFENRKTHSKVDEHNISGRDTELENIMSQLKQIDANKNISIISIVGLGGVGKTTLAKLVYNNDDELNGYFAHKMWVYVSQDFNIKRIVTAMIESISRKKCELEHLDPIVENITGQLKGNRLLLILDDIWIENQLLWDELENVLKCGAPGSKIITTTRSMRVSDLMKSTYTCNLNGLSEEMSWNLFKKRAFSRSEVELNSQILEIAKEIVGKCGGVPLALKTLGSTMHNKSVEKWKAIRNSEIWKTNNEVMASLELSYMNLSSELKECFAYCSIFPKGHVIYKEDLIGQWMANGLFSFTRSTGGMEDDLGNEYFEQLVQVSFLQNVVEQSYSTKGTCNMHDLVHDLAQSISDQRILLINDADKATNVDNGKLNPTKIKRMRALHISSGDSSVISIVSKAQNLRSLFLERIALVGTLPINISKLIHLRYICISNCEFIVISNDIGTLWNLETLHLRGYNMITYLPESIGKLINLRTLTLDLLTLKHLPESIGNLDKLCFLNLDRCWDLEKVPESIGNLINLKSLDLKRCENLKYLLESIGNLYKLCFLNLDGCRDLEKIPESIGNLINLESLDLKGCRNLKYLPESIGNQYKLCFLNLDECRGLEKVPESIGNLINLESLDLKRCENLKYLPESIGNLYNLCFLNLDRCWYLDKVPESIGNLINLESLDLKGCKNLNYLSESIGNLYKLCFLNLDGCWRLEKVPESIGNLINLEKLDLSMCENLKCLAESITNLDKLCSLKLHGCKSLEKIPESIGNLVNLESLDFSMCENLNTIHKSIYNITKLTPVNLDHFQFFYCIPAGISKLNGRDIQGLSFFSRVKENELVSISELEHLNIRGHLEISGLENLNDPGEATLANLKKKENLNGLKLTWYPYAVYNDCVKCSLPVLEALQPPSWIKSLDLGGYPGEQYPNWMMLSDEMRMTSFPNLTSLTLSHLKRCSNLPSLIGLPHLTYLKLEGILYLTNYSGHFPSLVELHLCEMPNLEEVTTMNLDTNNVYKPAFPRLSRLLISGCPKVRVQPHLPPSIVELKIEKSNELLLGVEFFDGESSCEICSSSLALGN